MGGEEANPADVHAAADRAPALGLAAETLQGHVEALARDRAARPYTPPEEALPAAIDDLDYAEYQAIRYLPERALWRGESPFTVQPLHRGSLHRKRVRIHVVEGKHVTRLAFDAGAFTYGDPAHRPGGAPSSELGFSGLQIQYPLNTPDTADEIAVFQGASYFRLLGPGHVHGLSARGVGVDIGDPAGEEFPDFTDFWLEKPGPDAERLVFHALLDGPSLTGAYRFELEPGATTTLRVDARLFAREDVDKLGVAPLSSMFLYGPNGSGRFDDFRPEVHDSDGLLMLGRLGEWVWRPLSNRLVTRTTSLRDGDPQGFGLAQRARAFERYLDLEARYHRRPSQWVEAVDGDWGVGGVELVELPTVSEFSDNIAASWVPDAPFRAGDERRYSYRLVTFGARLPAQDLAQVERTRVGWDALPGQADPPPRSQRRFVVDYAGGPLEGLGTGTEVRPVLDASSGTISDLVTAPLPDGLGWRASFRLEPDGAEPADLRLHLAGDGRRLSETWSYVWYPDEAR